VLSPSLFRFYIRDLMRGIVQMRIRCNNGSMISLQCFADDMVLLAPFWQGLQILIDTLFALASEINMSFNICKTVCMVYNPISSCKIVAHKFIPGVHCWWYCSELC